jgi:hypothetical protein
MLLVIWGSANTKMFVMLSTAYKFLSFSAEFISDVIRLSNRRSKKKPSLLTHALECQLLFWQINRFHYTFYICTGVPFL